MNHIKIWFAQKGTHPLGSIVNELRLIRQSRLYAKRNETLSLLTDFSHSTQENIQYVQSFCEKNSIRLIITPDIKNALHNTQWVDKDNQLKLFELAMLELNHPAGHPVIASDIFRLLSPVLALGAYSDIDEIVDYSSTANLDIGSLPELLLNITLKLNDPSKRDFLNTNFIFAKNIEHPVLVRYRSNILSNYNNSEFICSLKMYPTINVQVNNLNKYPFILPYQHFCAQYFLSCEENTPTQDFDFRQALKKEFPQHYQQFFYYYVLELAGPGAFTKTLFPAVFNVDFPTLKINEQIPTFRITEHGILLNPENLVKLTDHSWLDKGLKCLANEKDKMIESALIIQGFWRKHKKHNTAHAACAAVPPLSQYRNGE